MREVCSSINFSPVTFELPEDTGEDEGREDTKEGDKPVKKLTEPEKETHRAKKIITSQMRSLRSKL